MKGNEIIEDIGTPADGRAFNDLFVSTLPSLYRRLARIVKDGDAAADAVHDAYVKLSAPRLRRKFVLHPDPGRLALTTAINLVRDRWRRRTRMCPTDDVGEMPPPAADDLTRRQSELNVLAMLSKLSPAKALVVIMIDIEGRSIRQTAEFTGMSKSAVHARRADALAELRGLIRGEVLGEG